MKAIVTELFVDRDDQLKSYPVGTIVDFDEERIKDLSERQLVKVLDEPKPARKKRA